ncbi:MAG: PDZ domain-containing protein, partial [Planctomycetes bacterium]|nr:PDZ domain-containing protein [Planctomycetota bacterium]
GVEVEFIDAALRSQLNLADAGGVIVRSVKADSVAEKMGLKTHDVILSINGTGITTIWEFRRIIKGLLESGKKIKLEIIRQGKKQVIE